MDQSGHTTVDGLKRSFFYGDRSDLNVKFVKDLSDDQFGDFVAEVLKGAATAMDTGQPSAVIDAIYRWQIIAYRDHLGDPRDFPHRYDNTPAATLSKNLNESKLALVTSSGHFVAGDDPRPLGVDNMTQQEAEARIAEFLSEAPTISKIPYDVEFESLRVRHGGYPVQAVSSDPQVVLPLRHLQNLVAQGEIGRLSDSAWSFVGATSQIRLKNKIAPRWAAELVAEGVDAVLLVPI